MLLAVWLAMVCLSAIGLVLLAALDSPRAAADTAKAFGAALITLAAIAALLL